MKINTIVRAFFSQNRDEKPAIIKVFDSITDFKRKLELFPAYKELREANEMYGTERQKIINELIEGRNKQLEEAFNKRNEGKPDKEKVKFHKTMILPDDLRSELAERLNLILETEYKPKRRLKFTQKEIEASGINISEMLLIEEFMQLK